MSTTPIAEYAMVSDCHSAALVDRRGSLDWWCTPRFDSPSLFGRILDERAGHFSIRPVGDAEVERTYAEGTLVLTTTFRTVGGVVELTDALALADGVRGHDVGLDSRVRLAAGESVGFAVQTTSSWGPPSIPLTQDEIERRITDTIKAWRSWEAVHQSYRGVYPDLVRTSGRVLHGLTYQPTGAIVAAPTTSLPEVVGGARNWDYRYCWVRDASFTLNALWVAACPDEADRFLNFLTTAASSISVRRELQIMFGICGERDLTEHELPHLAGWRSSAPVRVGNGAWNQRQLDVYGELLGAVHRLQAVFEEFDESTMRFLVALADAAAVVWREKDQGIWEIRDEPRHYLYSKLMCWVALDRAIDMAGKLGADNRVETWAAERAAIRSVILEEGWSEAAGAFTQSFGSTSLDASNLVIPLVGFLPADDPRVAATIEATEQHLTDDRGLVYRYRSADGLAGHEGTFLLCTFWLAEALATAGRIDRARSVFDRAAAFANDVGLLSEEVEPATGELIGNYPQAFSHIGLINAAWAINEAVSRAG